MPEYTFDTLSPYDLEQLARDLLQAELGVRLESFARGRDRGIDLRYASDRANAIVVQCKHYTRSGWSDLSRSLKVEVPKVKALEPPRYVLVTSQSLTPDRKEWICNLLVPYCHGPADVFGAEDLNNLLGRHPDVERLHHKLWLTSVTVLEHVLHSDVFAEQTSEVQHIRRRLCRFVSNASVTRALDILSSSHFCVITGVPGIGKTTLAEMLVVDHLARGVECFRIWDDVADARRVLRVGKPQLFYYDDFLGKTGLRQPEKNADERLLRFISDVCHSPHQRLVLTTRDYILNQARSVLEGLSRADLDPSRCVVSLEDYTPLIRSEILYNHLYHSGIPQEHIEAVVESRAYRDIIRHRNYSPRIIEAMTEVLNVRDVAPDEYPAAFLANLENPSRLWAIAYNTHLTSAAQNALLVTASLADGVRLADAEEAFEPFHRRRCEKYNQPSTPYDWKRALRELEGTFITIGPTYGALTIRFHSASVRDFIEHHLRESHQDQAELVASAVFPDQLSRIGRILDATPDRSWVATAVERFVEIIDHRSGTAWPTQFGNSIQWRTRVESPIVRFIALSRLAGLGNPQLMREQLDAAVQHVLAHVATARQNREELVGLLDVMLERSLPHTDSIDELFAKVRISAYSEVDAQELGLDEYGALVQFADKHPDLVGDDICAELADQFGPFADGELDTLDQLEPDTRLQIYDQLAGIATLLGVQLSVTRDSVLEGINYWQDEDEESRFSDGGGGAGVISDGDLDSMFDSLRR